MQIKEAAATCAGTVADTAVIPAASMGLLAALNSMPGRFVCGAAGHARIGTYGAPQPADGDVAEDSDGYSSSSDSAVLFGHRLPVDASAVSFVSSAPANPPDSPPGAPQHGSLIAVACQGALHVLRVAGSGGQAVAGAAQADAPHSALLGSITSVHEVPWRAASWLQAPHAPGSGGAGAGAQAAWDPTQQLHGQLIAAVCQVSCAHAVRRALRWAVLMWAPFRSGGNHTTLRKCVLCKQT